MLLIWDLQSCQFAETWDSKYWTFCSQQMEVILFSIFFFFFFFRTLQRFSRQLMGGNWNNYFFSLSWLIVIYRVHLVVEHMRSTSLIHKSMTQRYDRLKYDLQFKRSASRTSEKLMSKGLITSFKVQSILRLHFGGST